MPTPTEIVLEYVCPILGVFLYNLMNAAPLKDLQTAVSDGTGLQDLNPTPWAFMVGTTLGFTVYAVLTIDWFLFVASFPGFLVACWLNLGAVKLIYADHHKRETRRSLVHFLAEDEKVKRKESTSSRPQQQQNSSSSDDEDADADDKIPGYNDGERSNKQKGSEDDDNGDMNLADVFAPSTRWKPSEVSLAPIEEDSSPTKRAETSKTTRVSFVHQKSSARRGLPARRGLSSRLGSLARLESVRLYTQRINHWGEIVWNVTSQKTPAKAPHERLVMAVIFLWAVVLSALGFYSHYAVPKADDTPIAQTVVGFVSNILTIFFYGAPLSRINVVITTKKSDILHLPTMVTNTLNAAMWFTYGVAPQINDPFIYGSSGVGLMFGIIQFALYLVFPRSKKAEAGGQRFSIVSMVGSSFRFSADDGAETTAVKPSSNEHEEGGSDLEMNHNKKGRPSIADFRSTSFLF
jgi:hypothetical protein